RWIVGRTISIYSAFTYGGIAGGSWFWGAIVQNYSLPSAMAWSAVATLGVAARVQAADQQSFRVGARACRRLLRTRDRS
ncbi:MFS transporter, partial [Mesorhizobium sp. M4B.F.Ca.ET.049.02.1.2]|uniref:MFS transporter n=1 Tax=Mesorhizobium sp. M4B.F.Ca.ET.049.02.1.2 TaxID=2496752 RepID=UPI0024788994